MISSSFVLFIPLASVGLFLLPGLAWVSRKEAESATTFLCRIFAVSLVALTIFSGAHRLLHVPMNQTTAIGWLLLWVHLGLLRKWIGRVRRQPEKREGQPHLRGVGLALGALALYGILYRCALFLVPPMMDHDWEAQSSAYGLIQTLTPLAITDRGLLYHFADPPVLNFQIGWVALVRGILPEMSYHYEMARSLGRQQGIFPQKEDLDRAVDQSRERFLARPMLLETRTPTLLFAVATLPILWAVLRLFTGSGALATAGSFLFFSFPETLVRASHGDFTAPAVFFLLVGLDGHLRRDSKTLFWSGLLGAITKSKQFLVLPLALALSAGLWESSGSGRGRIQAAVKHPALRGFFLGTLGFCLYGLLIHPQAFWTDFVQTHVWNRLFQIDTGGPYPSALRLWFQFHQVQGWLFLPLALWGLIWLLIRCRHHPFPYGGIALWTILGGGLFSITDWRQTRHLIYIVPPLLMGILGALGSLRGPLRWGGWAALGGMIARNLVVIFGSGGDLLALHPSGNW